MSLQRLEIQIDDALADDIMCQYVSDMLDHIAGEVAQDLGYHIVANAVIRTINFDNQVKEWAV